MDVISTALGVSDQSVVNISLPPTAHLGLLDHLQSCPIQHHQPHAGPDPHLLCPSSNYGHPNFEAAAGGTGLELPGDCASFQRPEFYEKDKVFQPIKCYEATVEIDACPASSCDTEHAGQGDNEHSISDGYQQSSDTEVLRETDSSSLESEFYTAPRSDEDFFGFNLSSAKHSEEPNHTSFSPEPSTGGTSHSGQQRETRRDDRDEQNSFDFGPQRHLYFRKSMITAQTPNVSLTQSTNHAIEDYDLIIPNIGYRVMPKKRGSVRLQARRLEMSDRQIRDSIKRLKIAQKQLKKMRIRKRR